LPVAKSRRQCYQHCHACSCSCWCPQVCKHSSMLDKRLGSSFPRAYPVRTRCCTCCFAMSRNARHSAWWHKPQNNGKRHCLSVLGRCCLVENDAYLEYVTILQSAGSSIMYYSLLWHEHEVGLYCISHVCCWQDQEWVKVTNHQLFHACMPSLLCIKLHPDVCFAPQHRLLHRLPCPST
jgi:hypothetical protein